MFEQTILPNNTTKLEKAMHLAIRDEIHEITIPPVWSADECPKAFLPYLASALGVYYWQPSWSEDEQRTAIRNAIAVARNMGTVAALKLVLKNAGYGDAIINEGATQGVVGGVWVVGESSIKVGEALQWAEFSITITQMITPQKAEELASLVAAVTPAWTHLKYIRIQNINIVVGGEWIVGDSEVTVGGVYQLQEQN